MSVDYLAIDQALIQAAQDGKFRFNAHHVTRWSSESDANEVNQYLLTKVGTWLTAKLEVLCPNNHGTQYEFGNSIPSHEIECYRCREEFVPDPDRIQIVYYFIEDFKEQVKKKVS